MKDFLFDIIDSSIDRHELEVFVHSMPEGHLSIHLNRVLEKAKNNRLQVQDDTSMYDVGPLLRSIKKENISLLRILERKNENEYVGRTFDIEIILANGVLEVQTYWTDYKDIRFDELICYMLAPIYKYELQERTLVRIQNWGCEDGYINVLPGNIREGIASFARLKGYRLKPEDMEKWEKRAQSDCE